MKNIDELLDEKINDVEEHIRAECDLLKKSAEDNMATNCSQLKKYNVIHMCCDNLKMLITIHDTLINVKRWKNGL